MKRILVIDDDPLFCRYLSELIENNNFKVTLTHNGKEGIKTAKVILPDLIICDMLLPDVDGFKVLASLKRYQTTKNIPFILMSAYRKSFEDIRLAMKFKADDYLIKPFQDADVLTSITNRLKKYEELSKNHNQYNNGSKKSGKAKLNGKSKWILVRGGNVELLNADKIVYLQAEADYTKVFTEDGKKHRVSRLLKKWEEILPQENFLRIHRSAIVNLVYVKKIEKWFNNSYRIYVHNVSEPLVVSRRYVKKVKSYFLELPV